MASPRIGIIGTGIVGGTVAAQMRNAGIDVTVMDTNESLVDVVCQTGFRLTGAMTLQSRPIMAYPSTAEALDDGETFDAVFVCVKAPFNKLVVGDVPSMLVEGGMAVSFQNGIDTELELLAAVGADQTLRGVCNYAGGPVTGDLGALNVVFNHPPNHIGAALAENGIAIAGARRIADLMNTGGLETAFATHVTNQVWQKAIMNAAMTPVAALSGKTMKEVMAGHDTRALVQLLMREAISVAEAKGIDLDEGLDLPYFEYAIGYLDKAGPHNPSMWYDFQNGVQTEILVLNDAIAQHGIAARVLTPSNREIADKVLAKDALLT